MLNLIEHFPHLLDSMRLTQDWLHGKIASLQEYLDQPMVFEEGHDNGLSRVLATRDRIHQTLGLTHETIQGLQQIQESGAVDDPTSLDWMIQALRLQYKGYSQHLDALDLMPVIWEQHHLPGVYEVIGRVIEALQMVAQGQQQIIQGLEFVQYEPEYKVFN